jgi:hypothetical protein
MREGKPFVLNGNQWHLHHIYWLAHVTILSALEKRSSFSPSAALTFQFFELKLSAPFDELKLL